MPTLEDTIEPTVYTAIGALLTEFCWRVDQGEGRRVADLFTQNGSVTSPHFHRAGREEIGALYQSRADTGDRLTRHFWSNLRVTPNGEGRFGATSYAMTAVGAPPAPVTGGDLVLAISTDVITFEDGRPLFASRSLAVTFEGRITSRESA